ncbi:hypothetical protein DPMN_185950 [Dreissena polymorpha]|uniref:Helicase ATP-binding domain-containing protein n=1 Tax=Dreissena polymorpha TaxID=45954 RepID=A0A9D4DLD9_DREPO|nr:hypothetical protein DPMN_185950 [Dreissena polymorpha]
MGEGNVCGGIVAGGECLGRKHLGARGASGIPAKGDSVVNVPLEEIVEGEYSLVYAHPEAFLSTSIGTAILRAFERDITVSCIAFDEAHMILEWQLSQFYTYFLLYNIALLS